MSRLLFLSSGTPIVPNNSKHSLGPRSMKTTRNNLSVHVAKCQFPPLHSSSFELYNFNHLPKAQMSDLLLNLLYIRTSGGDHRTGNLEPTELVYSSSRTYLPRVQDLLLLRFGRAWHLLTFSWHSHRSHTNTGLQAPPECLLQMLLLTYSCFLSDSAFLINTMVTARMEWNKIY